MHKEEIFLTHLAVTFNTQEEMTGLTERILEKRIWKLNNGTPSYQNDLKQQHVYSFPHRAHLLFSLTEVWHSANIKEIKILK